MSLTFGEPEIDIPFRRRELDGSRTGPMRLALAAYDREIAATRSHALALLAAIQAYGNPEKSN